METIHCNDCGFTGENEDNGLDLIELMDQYEAGDLAYEDYNELVEGTRFACPNCGCVNTEISA